MVVQRSATAIFGSFVATELDHLLSPVLVFQQVPLLTPSLTVKPENQPQSPAHPGSTPSTFNTSFAVNKSLTVIL